MRRFALALAVGALFTLPAQARAQTSRSATAAVSASIVTALTMGAPTPLNFGAITANGTTQTVTVRPTDAGAAAFTATGQLNTPITVTWTTPAALNDGAGHTMAVNSVSVSGLNTNAQGSATALTSGGTVTLDATTGRYYFWVGGQISVGPSQPAGTYTTTFTLNVAY